MAGAVVLAALGTGAVADPGKIIKYVFPDGRVVYSDKPVPGAVSEQEVTIEPGPPAPTPAPEARRPAADDGAKPAGPQSTAAPTESPVPVAAEVWDGRCHLRVTGQGQVFAVHVEGLVPDEPLEVVSTSDGETITSDQRAQHDGTYGTALFPAVAGKSSGTTTFTVTSARCWLSATFSWSL